MKNKSTIFTSKADVLEFLISKIKYSIIEENFSFNIEYWNKNHREIIKVIQKKFKKNLIVVRSSAMGEDSVNESGAGCYESILNVDSKSKKLIISAIKKVIKSYRKKGNFNENNQIIIQKQTTNTDINGVIFTGIPDSGTPYYIINYNENNDTESVTKGLDSKVVKIFKNIELKKIDKKWKKLIRAVRELEKILNEEYLDIEFGISNKNIIIFQVRPMTNIRSPVDSKDEKIIEKLILQNKSKFKKIIKQRNFPQKYSYFSDMTDWNPAEIIGNSPNRLDFSLYQHIIMKNAWHKGRCKIGYQEMGNYPLMVNFGNKPYVDIKGSFNSLIPNNIKKKYKSKLMNYYFKKFKSMPHLHDKVEFDILFTCYDYDIKNRLKELLNYNFTKNEINEIENELIKFTNKIIDEFIKIKDRCEENNKIMQSRREEIAKKLDHNNQSVNFQIESIKKLLKDCINFGTIEFSSMARIAFIGSILLKSLEKKKIITNNFIETFMNSIKTPLSDFQNDIYSLKLKNITREDFLQKYGHLRSGTYDITAIPYNKQFSFIENFKNINLKSQSENKKKLIKNPNNLSPLKFENISFLDFVQDGLIQREKIKFEFTKNLSMVLEIIAKIGKSMGFEREDLANLDIKSILKSSNKSKNEIKQIWKKKIMIELKNKKYNNKLVLPSIIFSAKDFEIINYHISKPNFITKEKIISKTILLEKNKNFLSNIYNKIILIENADPGYDWIFTKNPVGLITKFGGVASHMSIRCAEMNLPAAIGCGEIIFDQLIHSKKILLDCKNEQIFSLEDSKINELMEVKKVLKSLGYIK